MIISLIVLVIILKTICETGLLGSPRDHGTKGLCIFHAYMQALYMIKYVYFERHRHAYTEKAHTKISETEIRACWYIFHPPSVRM